jgi:deoxyribonuclease V
MSKKIITTDVLPAKIRLIAGVDVAYAGNLSIGAVAVLDYGSLKTVESETASCSTVFPYIPTLLSFREIKPTLLSIYKLKTRPDIILVDGQGYAHPYRCGFASHLGILLRKPTIGVAKTKLLGKETNAKETITFLEDKGETIGARVMMKKGLKPVYVSVGNMVSLNTAIKIAKHCIRFDRIPEPIVAAHDLATEKKRKINND